jgi:cytochrome bd ubiquinol oxidase subunit I
VDVEVLSRIQFAFTISFHYIYPPLSIGLGLIMVLMEGQYLRTGEQVYHKMARFYTKIFALIFGIGVATGIVMEFEFGTNWATYSRYVGDVFGSALAAEGIFAFALESGFLGVLLFGWNKVSPRVHFFSTVMVFLGSMFSAIWIVVANSWQQTPSGYHIVGEGMQARAEITDFWAMVFNPSSIDRVMHVWIGSFLAGAFLVLSISSWYILKQKYVDFAQRSFRIALVVAAIAAIAQLLVGHRSAEIVAEYQPAKLAAMEGHYDSAAVADLYLFGWVDTETQEVIGLRIPKGLTLLIHSDLTTSVRGLNSFNPGDRPRMVNIVFQSYHLMISIGVFLIFWSCFLMWLWYRNRLFNYRWVLIVSTWSVLLPQLANQAGWYAAETGRQPWVVYGLLKTSDALSKNVTANQVLFSLILFSVVYALLFALFIYMLNKKITHGPDLDDADIQHSPQQQRMANFME